MKKLLAIGLLTLGTLPVMSKTVTPYDPQAETSVELTEAQTLPDTDAKNILGHNHSVLSGFSLGLLGNLGYAFASTPAELYRNGTLNSDDMSVRSVTLGVGALARIHFYDHLHIGAEGYLSSMPMMRSGSNIKHGYAGALIDGFMPLGPVSLYAGSGIGGGKVKRTFVPGEAETVKGNEDVVYNASYTTTPFFYLDPYVGLEVHFGGIFGLNIKLDYLLPFGTNKDGIVKDLKWSNFITPSGPRLHIGVLIGK